VSSPEKNVVVDPEALVAFAKASRGRAERFRTLHGSFHDGHVPRHAFGVMPASFSLAAAYAEQFEACLQGLADAAELMDDVAEGVTYMAENYTATDVATADLFSPGPDALAPGPGIGPGAGNPYGRGEA
jgi:hypothetical protein